MKIAFIVSTFPPYRGGIGNVAYHEARQLAHLGNEVTVFTPRHDAIQDKVQKVDSITIRRLFPVGRFGNAAFLPQLLWLLRDADILYLHYPFFGGAEIMWSSRIIHEFFTNYTRIFTRIFLKKKIRPGKNSKLVIRYHMDVVGRGVLGVLFRFYTRYIMPRIIRVADKIIVSSFDYISHSDIKELIQQDKEKFIEIPFGVDLERFRPKPKDDLLLNELGITKDEKIVMFVGNLDRAHYFKGVEYLIQALSLLEDRPYKLVVVGEGDLRNNYELMGRKLGITERVIFAGAPSDRGLPNYYNIADVVVLPSIDKSEAFGLVLIEAMACAKPVIASNLAGVRTVVSAYGGSPAEGEDGVNGFLVKPKNTVELANRIDYVLSNQEMARQMGERGRERVEKFYNWDNVGHKLLQIFNE